MSMNDPRITPILLAAAHFDVVAVRQLLQDVDAIEDLETIHVTTLLVEPCDPRDSDDARTVWMNSCHKQCAILSMLMEKHALSPADQKTLFQDVFQQRRQDLFNVIYPYVTSSVLNDWDGVEKHHQWDAMMQEAESFHTQKILVQSLDGVTKDKSSNKSSKM